jgi:hypothetical protein
VHQAKDSRQVNDEKSSVHDLCWTVAKSAPNHAESVTERDLRMTAIWLPNGILNGLLNGQTSDKRNHYRKMSARISQLTNIIGGSSPPTDQKNEPHRASHCLPDGQFREAY